MSGILDIVCDGRLDLDGVFLLKLDIRLRDSFEASLEGTPSTKNDERT